MFKKINKKKDIEEENEVLETCIKKINDLNK